MKHFQEQDLEVIQDYLTQQLSASDRMAFEARVAADPALQQELEEYKAFVAALEQQEDQRLKNLLRNTHDEDLPMLQSTVFKSEPIVRKIRILPWVIAATVLLVLSFFAWRFFSGNNSANYLRNERLSLVDLSGEFDQMRASKMIAVPPDQPNYKVEKTIVDHYNRGEYQTALTELEKLPTKAVTLFYRAKCLIALHREQEAISLLKKVETYTAETYSNLAQWLLAIAYYQSGDRQQAKTYAEKAKNNSGIEDRERQMAKEMLEKLE